MSVPERFTSRWGLILAAIGMAVGAGNIWRFPRIVAENGGSAFLIPWIIFLFIWSIPLLIAEFAIGKHTRKGTIGSFAQIMGGKFAWMGSFVGFCTMGIMFYYSVVTGWSLFYFVQSISGKLATTGDYETYWNWFSTSYWPLLVHLIAISFAGIVVYKGIVKGIEKAAKIFVPLLFILLIIAAARALFLPNALAGLNFLFNPDFDKLLDYQVWLQALSQSAWSTGAGWGLILTYAVYMKQKEDVNLNAYLVGLGNNSASLIVALAIIPTVFSILGESKALEVMSQGNQGFTFIWMPQLFNQMAMGSLFSTVFFFALFIAALSSLIPMVELTARIFMDFGMERQKAVKFVWLGTLLLGVPSALSLDFFDNQDWNWGLGLMLSGFFFALAVRKFGAEKFRTELVNTAPNDLRVGKWYSFLIKYVIPIEFVVLIVWWSYQSVTVYEPESWWNPFKPFSLGTCIFQWGIAIGLFMLFNKKIVNKIHMEAQ
ncbi:sodium-dependent transporter [candidate division KSB1 bacterium]|nr:sodium-dependent transporter [candidate division KSB1 bacterium]